MTSHTLASLLTDLKTALAAQDRATINALVASLIAARAPIGGRWQSLAEVMLHNGEFDLARKAIALHTEHFGYNSASLFQEAAVLARCGDLFAARRILVALPNTGHDGATQAYTLGMIELNLGNIAGAQDLLFRAAKDRPSSGAIWLALAMTMKVQASDTIAQSILAMERQFSNADPLERAQYAYARGKVFHDIGEHGKAFAAVQAAGELMRRIRPYSRAEDKASARASTRGWTSDVVRSINAFVSRRFNRAIIVTGTPRSGTTLVEHILATHSEVADGAEVGSFALVEKNIGGFSSDAAQAKASTDPDGVSAFYDHILRQRFGPSGRVVDKTVNASRYLGTLAAFVPDVPIVWLRRNALDRAWSCYRTYFAQGCAWSSSLGDIAHHFRLENELLEFWRDVLGDRLMVLDYESVTKDPGKNIPPLLAHCGLAFEQAVLNPELSDRTVTTASVAQVRDPINDRAVGVANNYADKFLSFRDVFYKLDPAK